MIVNHRYKFIFVKTRKVGGTSLEVALSKYCDQNDIITKIIPGEDQRIIRGYQGPVNYQQYHFQNHTPAYFIKEKLGDAIWNSYYKFTVLRDPVDWVISEYYWQNKKSLPDFNEWMYKLLENDFVNWNIHTIDNNPAMNFYVLYEQMNKDLTKLSQTLGLPGDLGDEVKSINLKGGIRNNRRPEITDQLRKKINEWAKQELDLIYKIRSS